MAARSYQDLVVWQKAMDLAVLVYHATRSFPQEEVYGLTAQMRRAVTSVPSNIAEGQGRGSTKDFQRFLHISYGSLQETETQILLSQRLNYIDHIQSQLLLDRCAEIGRLLNGLRNSLTNRT